MVDNSSSRWLGAALGAIVILAIAGGGYWFYNREARNIRSRAYNELGYIAKLKVDEIANWRQERRDDALLIAAGLQRGYDFRNLQTADGTAGKADIIEYLRVVQNIIQYDNIILAAPDGHWLISLNPRLTALEANTKKLATQAVSSSGVVWGDFYRCSSCDQIHLDLAARILDKDQRPAAVLILRIDPEKYLYPLVQSWPVASPSAETLLVRQEGDDVLFLNKLRHAPDPPLSRRLPMSFSSLPAAMAVKGRIGEFEGLDYRGVEVLADLKRVPDSPWFMVAKVNKDEMLAELDYREKVILGFVGLLILLTGAGVSYVYQDRQKHIYQNLLRAEQEKGYAQEEIRATLYGIGDGIISTDVLGHIKRINPVAEQLTGWSEAEALGRPLEQVFHIINEETRLKVDNPLAKVVREKLVVGLANHTLLIARDGKERPIADSGAPIYSPRGEVMGMVLVFRDQSQERSVQQALQESETRFRQISSTISDIVYSCRRGGDGGYVIDWMMGASAAITGYAVEEIQASGCWCFLVLEEDLPLFEQHVNGLAPGQTGSTELRIRHKNGAIVWLSSIAKCIRDPESPGQSTIYGALLDITSRKLDEDALRKLSRAVEQSPVSVVITDLKGDIDYVNPKFTQITGYSLEEARGQNPRILKSGEMPIEEYQKLWGTIIAGNEWHGEFHNKRKDGTFFWERASISPIRDAAGVVTHFIAVKEDITQQKILESQFQQAQKMESVGRLAGGVAHDFNNMLGVIIGRTEMALAGIKESVPLYNDLQEILKAATRSSELVRQLLAFARKQISNPRILDLNDTVEGMLKILRRLIGEDIELIWKPGLLLWPVKIDPAQVDQILANLTVNARDAIAGVGTLTIETDNEVLDEAYCRTHAECLPGSYVVLSVSDTGEGMDKETLGLIFEPFFTTKEVGRGTGLGLSTVYGIVKQNNGFINVYSEPGQGTTFKIYLPQVAADVQVLPELFGQETALGHETILLVEDEEAILSLGAEILKSFGYTVLAAPSPREALALAEQYAGPIHLLITDVVMPEMNGRELQEKLAAMRPEMQVLFMSGYTADIIAHRGVLDEGVQFLQKPFSVKTILTKVREVLKE